MLFSALHNALNLQIPLPFMESTMKLQLNFMLNFME